ncbi:MAG: anhydro-N-acetylmuramic acid kinase [Chitinophagaceae bacterium]|jgi:anhydro-N-acetylmuramic acid kinase|nr:anhydro-N-acetylmuramic acid kinase [Chitinophagaceae bacterium]
MNPTISKLFEIAQKNNKRIIGLMSGTSLDGLDIAVCNFTGHGLATKITVEHFETIAYNDEFRKDVLSIFSKEQVSLEKLCLLNALIGTVHAKMINACLQKWSTSNATVDIIASHGQTIYHAPQSLHKQLNYPNATLQIGDGDHIAVNTGIITLSDFRQKHIAAGGEGAPLAIYGDYLIFGKKGENRVMLNIGGIANFTFLSGTMLLNEVFSTDVGPGNTLMDAFIQKEFAGKNFDKNATIALQGKTNQSLLVALKQHPFFTQSFPKTTGPELFNLDYLYKAIEVSNTTHLSKYDIMATLNRFTAEAIVNALQKAVPVNNYSIYISGGGMHNPLLMQHLQELLPTISIKTTQDLNIHPDAKEAVLFAILANECLSNPNNNTLKNSNGVPSIAMGKISLPN